ncbi:aldo/keto reductase [Protaetiibacter intestinalis]|uniref:Aldo/keto reductase n=1 Tax=Protaetiibacter intestinalis TaxID=2419774 RepID=A0A387B6S6_9MICO|nr:aldo/keto reductase [Protaetiibacter intestinalis]AYF98047.1 aldo/keto reductase [Protaetiibacter intestinalis]
MTELAGLEVGEQGFGGMALAEVYGPTDEASALATLHHALDAGIRLIDTADVYGAGSNERLVGRVLRERRDEVVLATKFGFLRDPAPGGPRFRGDPAYVREAVQGSLGRLGVERIELYYYHRVDPRVPIEETVGALAELVAEGVVERIGLSEVTAAELERAHAVHPITAVQSEWSIWSRDVETAVIPTAARLGVGFVAYSPLGRGFLVSPVTQLPEGDLRRNFPRFDAERLAANAPIGETVRAVAEAEGITPAQLALAWLGEQGRALGVDVVPIPSTRRPERIDENLAASGIRLSAAALAALEPLGARVAGDRARHVGDISQGRERTEAAG